MTTTTQTSVGRIARVTGPVVDVEFPVEGMPALYNALEVDVDFGDGEKRLLTLGCLAHWRQHGSRDLDAANGRSSPWR